MSNQQNTCKEPMQFHSPTLMLDFVCRDLGRQAAELDSAQRIISEGGKKRDKLLASLGLQMVPA